MKLLKVIVVLLLLEFSAGQLWKSASNECLKEHTDNSYEIEFLANCRKKKGVFDFDDMSDLEKHQCYMMRRYCAKKCKKEGTCPVKSLFTLNLNVNEQTYESLDCACIYSKYVSGCTNDYTATWSEVKEEFNANCAVKEETTTTAMMSTTTNIGLDLKPWFQLYVVRFNDHLYTLDPAHVPEAVRHGHIDDGIVSYMMSEESVCVDKVRVLTYFDKVTSNHFYTTNVNEVSMEENNEAPNRLKVYCVKSNGQCGASMPIQRYQHTVYARIEPQSRI